MTPPAAPRLAAPAWRFAAITTVAVAVAAALALATLPSAEVWASLTSADCSEYCEASTRCGPLATRDAVQQPANAWSNLAFLFAGALAWRRPLRPLAVLFAASCAVLALGSFLFHATMTREMQWLDMVGTYAALVAVVARGAEASYALGERTVVCAALVADALFAAFKWVLSAFVALPLLMLAAAIPIGRAVALGRRPVGAALVPLALFAAAFGVRQLDVAHVACAPDGLLQGHALWHVLSAASLAWSYFFFESPAAPSLRA